MIYIWNRENQLISQTQKGINFIVCYFLCLAHVCLSSQVPLNANGIWTFKLISSLHIEVAWDKSSVYFIFSSDLT